MGKRRAGVPAGFTFEVEKPSKNDKPIRMGDYLDEIDRPLPKPVRESKPKAKSKPKQEEVRQPLPVEEPTKQPAHHKSIKRARLNVSMEGHKRLGALVSRMKKLGPEPTIAASEIVEALILSAYEAQEHLDLSNVRQRGKYGSPSHKNFPVAISESLSRAISEGNTGNS